MTENPNDRGDATSTTGADLVIPVAGIALAIYYFSTILDSPWTAKVTALFVGVVLIGLSLVVVVRSLLRLRSGAARLSFHDLVKPVDVMPKRLALLALTVVNVIVMPWVGFTLTSIVFLTLATLLLTDGRNVKGIVPLAVGLSLTWFVVFVLIFQRHFPLGWLDRQIKDLVSPLLKSIGLQ